MAANTPMAMSQLAHAQVLRWSHATPRVLQLLQHSTLNFTAKLLFDRVERPGYSPISEAAALAPPMPLGRPPAAPLTPGGVTAREVRLEREHVHLHVYLHMYLCIYMCTCVYTRETMRCLDLVHVYICARAYARFGAP